MKREKGGVEQKEKERKTDKEDNFNTKEVEKRQKGQLVSQRGAYKNNN